MNAADRVSFLEKCAFFGDLEKNLLEEIASLLVVRNYSSGEVVYWEGESNNKIYFVKRGWLKVTKTSDKGRELTLNLLRSGDMFNLVSAFTDAINPASVVALEDADLYYLDADSFHKLAMSSPGVYVAFIRQLAGRVRSLTDLAGGLSLSNVETRIADWLVKESSGDIILRKKWLTQNELAALVGTVPDVLNRVFRDFVEEGLIRFNRREIKLLDRNALLRKIRNLS